jgi:hypothetical protein
MTEQELSFQYNFRYMRDNDIQEKKVPLHMWNR